MKTIPALTTLLCLTMHSILGLLSANAAPSDAPSAIVGRWSYFEGGTVVLSANGHAKMTSVFLNLEGDWSLISKASGHTDACYSINWEHGKCLDTIHLSGDRQHLYGQNQFGVRISANRLGGTPADGPAPAPATTTAQANPNRRGVTVFKMKPIENSAEEIGEKPVSDERAPELIERRDSPNKKYAIEMVNKPWLSKDKRENFNNYYMIALLKDGKVVAEYPTFGELGDAYWSPDGKFVAVNNIRSHFGGDQIWLIALEDGKALKRPDDATGKMWMQKGEQALIQRYPETDKVHKNGKRFLFLQAGASAWTDGRFLFTTEVEMMFEDLEGRFDYVAAVAPTDLKTIQDSKLTKKKL